MATERCLSDSGSAISRRAVMLGAMAPAAVLAACGPVRPSGPAGPAAPTSLSGKVSAYFWGSGALATAREEAMRPFTQKFPHAQYEHVTIPGGYFGGYYDKIHAMMAGGAAPDLFMIAMWDFDWYWAQKQVRDLDPFVRRDRYDLSDFPKTMVEAYRHQGKGFYGLPDGLQTIALLHNVDLLTRLGVKPPPATPDDRSWTFEALRETALRLTKRDQDPPMVGFQPILQMHFMHQYVQSTGGDFLNKDGTQVVLHEEPALEALQFLADLHNKWRVVPAADDLKGMNLQQLFLAGRLAMWENGSWIVATLRQGAGFPWDAGFRPYGKARRIVHMTAQPLVMWSGTKVPDLAWEVLKFFQDEAMLAITAAGALQGTKVNAHQRKHFLQPGKPPKHAEVFVTSAERFSRLAPRIRNFPQVQQTWDEEIVPIWQGRRTAREGVMAFKQRVDPLLQPARGR